MSKSDKPAPISIEDGSLRMSFRTAVIGAIGIFAAAASFHVYAADLSHKSDLVEHKSTHAGEHLITLQDEHGHDATPVPMAEVVTANAKAVAELPAIRKAVDEANDNSITVKNGFYDAQASKLGRRAADRMPEGTSWRKRKAKHDEVKAKARQNLDDGKPAGSGDLARFDF